jgi:hypothetical protein
MRSAFTSIKIFYEKFNMPKVTLGPIPKRVLEDVYVTEGVPEETFIDPPNIA